MVVVPQTAEMPDTVYRVGRSTSPLFFGEIDALDAEIDDHGNRFDVVGAGVMYAATRRKAAYKETLQQFRPRASSAAFEPSRDEHLMRVGSVPASWRTARVMVQFSLVDTLPFLDVEQDETLTFLTRELAKDLERLGVSNLDSSNVRGPSRRLTRLIARWAYTRVDEDDEAIYSGIRYSSRFESEECWAIFDGVRIGSQSSVPIVLSDDDLASVAREFGITIH